jgi:hypothetical protein
MTRDGICLRARGLTLGAVALAALTAALWPVSAVAAKTKQVNVQADMTLQRIDDETWQLYVENASRNAVAISWITWTAPVGLKVEQITNSSGGTCRLAGGGFECRTQLAPPSCPTCEGEGLTVNFKGTGFDGRYVKTSYGGYWVQQGWRPGGAAIIATPGFADVPICKKGQTSTKAKPCAKA